MHLPGRCTLLVNGLAPAWWPCDRTTSAGVSSAAWECRIECPPHSWCRKPSLRCRTSSEPLWTSDEPGSPSLHWWRPASPERLYVTILEMLTTVPESSMSLASWAPQPDLDASVNSVTSISWMVRGKPCRTTGDAHQATSCRTHWGTVILSVQSRVLWHQAVAAHRWIGWSLNLPGRTSLAMNTTMPSNLCRSLAVKIGLLIQCWWTDWTLRCIFGRGATVNCRVLKCIPRNWKSWLGVRSDFLKLITHPSLWSMEMVISECFWACSGDSARISQSSK